MTYRTLFPAILLLLTAMPIQKATAQERFDLPPLVERGLDLMLRQMAPELHDFKELLLEVPRYDAPDVLPNGDIIIRRRNQLATPPPEGQIDL